MQRMYTTYYVAEICLLAKQNWVKNYVVGGPLQKMKLQWLLQALGTKASISMSFLSLKKKPKQNPKTQTYWRI